ncbi:MAG: PAS domain S-box protein [Burkholderiales bacterium]|nr:PAS domain S-box protein [Burkholderiales bacterium]
MNDRINPDGAMPGGDAGAGEARDQMRLRAMAALRRGEFDLAEQAISRGDATLAELVENLRIYQMELQMQADELLRSQAQTQQALDRFSALFSNLPVPALLVDANGVVLEANRHAEEGFGITSAMMRGYLFHRLIDADDYQAEVRGALLDARATGHADVAAVRFRAAGGQQMVGDLHIESLADPVGGAQQYACVMIDRTEQLADLEQLQSSLARLRAREHENQQLADAMLRHQQAVLMLDAAGRITWASEDVLELTGYAPAELSGHPVLELLCRDDSVMADCSKRIAEGTSGRHAAAHLRRKDGGSIAVSLDLLSVPGAAPRFIVLLAQQAVGC